MKERRLTRNKMFKQEGIPHRSDTLGEYHEEDVKTAKEWLIQQIEEAEPSFRDEDSIIQLINEAFQL